MSGLSIKDNETEQLVRRAAKATGLSMTRVVRLAVSEFYQRRSEPAEASLDDIRALTSGFTRPDNPAHFGPESLYDESGLPA